MSERALIQQLKSGHEAAYKVVYNEYKDNVLNVALGYVPNMHDAEDILQNVFIEVFRSVSNFKGDSALSTWIYRITINKCLEYLRHRGRKKRSAFFSSTSLDDDIVQGRSDVQYPGITLENQERANVLYSHIERLGEDQRTAFILKRVEGRSQKEISEIMERSEKSVESLLSRATSQLRKSLREYYEKKLI